MPEMYELTEEELELVSGGSEGRGSSSTVVVLKDIGNHDGNGNTVNVGSGNGITVELFV